MGFRSYVRHFRGAILGLLRPSEAWCFPAGRWFFPWCFPIWGPDVKVAKIHSSSKRKQEPKASFSIGFRSYVRHFRGAILGLLRPSAAWCFPARRWFFPWCFPIRGPAAAVLSVSEVTLGIFGVQFSGFSVLQRQGVSLPGGDFFHGVFPSEDQQQQQKPLQQQEEKVAKIHSSSKRKKQPKSSFSMGFRSYVKHFRGAILGLLRPSEAWCFLAGRWFFPWCFPIWGPDVKVAKIHVSRKKQKGAKIIIFYGFQKLR